MATGRFFRAGAACERYARYRDATDEPGLETKAEIESTWARVAPFVDDNLPFGAMQKFSARYWEMELAEMFLQRRIRLAQKADSKGPDLRLVNPPCWVEAIVPGPGSGDDEVPRLSGPGWVDHEKVILRLRAALKEKHEKYLEWVAKKTIEPRDPLVVAVNGCAIGMALLEPTVPYIVSAVAPFGELAITFNPKDPDFAVTESYRYRPSIPNARRATILTTIFTDSSHAGLSGTLYAWSDEVNRPRWPGGGYIFVHNPHAVNPLPPGNFTFGREYFIDERPDGVSLRRCDHPQ